MSDSTLTSSATSRLSLRDRFLLDARWYRQRGAALSALTFAVIFVVLAIALPGSFLTGRNFGNLLGQLPPLFIAGIGQTLVLLGGGFDLSVGSVISLTSAILALPLHWSATVPMALGAAIAVGLVNGWGIVKIGVHPIIMTLATSSIVQGIALTLLPVPGGIAPAPLVAMVRGDVLGLPLGALWVLVIGALAIGLTHGTGFGRALYAVGANPAAARLSGLPEARIRISTYVISASSAAVAGMYLTARLASSDPNVGSALGLDSVLAAALGGTLLSGGIGGPIGTVFGVGIIGLLNNGMNLAGISPFYQHIVKGTMLIVSVSLFRRKEVGL
ncbi:ABC transporter permease [Thalassovita aquimarina]|uniref:Autoinducer 2 import system permease protein LsrD n=1 Tax=Thalassovita aquimarina TaxID=2785917 RepID=A0ABS5HUV2_9RHOB|nr:ABC transporter permease [Thalassovita aquimarina]MBR9652711.1 ABC transporter permease [Thalassovita aquimarina]